jgi:hypothetical protein
MKLNELVPNSWGNHYLPLRTMPVGATIREHTSSETATISTRLLVVSLEDRLRGQVLIEADINRTYHRKVAADDSI